MLYTKGENKGKKISESSQGLIEMLLSWQAKEFRESKKAQSSLHLQSQKESNEDLRRIIVNSGIEEDELNNLYAKKIDLVVSEEEVQLEENFDKKIRFIKEIIDYDFNSKEKVRELEAEVCDLREQLKTSSQSRNILIVGKSDSGKSTLASVLSNASGFVKNSNSSEACFEEFSAGRSVRYKIIDTPGFNNGLENNEEFLNKVTETVYSLREGINQILFVVKEKMDNQEVINFAEEVNKYVSVKFITIVQTHSDVIENRTCQLNSINDVINIIYVNNCPNSPNNLFVNKCRDISRRNLLKHLQENCGEVYCPDHLMIELIRKIRVCITERERLQKRLCQESCIQQQEDLKNLLQSESDKTRRLMTEYMEKKQVN